MYVSLPEGKHPRWNLGHQWTRSGGGKLMMCNLLVTKTKNLSDYVQWVCLYISMILIGHTSSSCLAGFKGLPFEIRSLCRIFFWPFAFSGSLGGCQKRIGRRCWISCFLVGDVICLWAISSLEIGQWFPTWDFHHCREVAYAARVSFSIVHCDSLGVDCLQTCQPPSPKASGPVLEFILAIIIDLMGSFYPNLLSFECGFSMIFYTYYHCSLEVSYFRKSLIDTGKKYFVALSASLWGYFTIHKRIVYMHRPSPIIDKLLLSYSSINEFKNGSSRWNASSFRIRWLSFPTLLYSSGRWFGTCFILPYIGNNHPNWLMFFRWVETTNQSSIKWLNRLYWCQVPFRVTLW